MKITELLITGKKSQETCEDGVAINADFIAVIDGSTSKTLSHINYEMTNGRYCMELIRRYIFTMTAKTSVEDFCNGITEYISAIYSSCGINLNQLKEHPEDRLSASAIIYSAYHNEVWLIGDCQCLIDNVHYDNVKPQEALLASRRAAYLATELETGRITMQDVLCGNDPGREHIIEDLIQNCQGQNKTFSVIDGFPIPLNHVKILKPAPCSHEIILASDGYPTLCPTLTASENALSQQLANDPLCIYTFKATKGLHQGSSSFDDRTYIRFTT